MSEGTPPQGPGNSQYEPGNPPQYGPNPNQAQGYGPPPAGYGQGYGQPPAGGYGPVHSGIPPQPKKKRHGFRNFVVLPIVGIVVLIIIIAVASSGGGDGGGGGGDTASAAADSDTESVTYRVTGDADSADITYIADANFNESQANGEPLPFRKKVTFKKQDFVGNQLSLVAQSKGTSGAISCQILVDGKSISKQTSTGEYAVVTCGGSSDGE